jgi:hypothetical protein
MRAAAALARPMILSGATRGAERLMPGKGFALHTQADALLDTRHRHIAIVTGFPVIVPDGRPVLENDGPLGAGLLAAAMLALGWRVTLITDTIGRDLFAAMDRVISAAGPSPDYLFAGTDGMDAATLRAALKRTQASHLLAIERPGRAADGEYYNMRGQPVTAHTTNLDSLFASGPWRTAAFADGGNEIGMGAVPLKRIASCIDQGRTIASRTTVDQLTICGVSNWGAYGLLAFLRIGAPDSAHIIDRYLDVTFDQALFDAAKIGGAVDGVTKVQSETVDGLPLALHHAKLEEFRKLALDHAGARG